MQIDKKQIKGLAELAQLDLSEEELEAQRRDLERLATYSEVLKELDTEGLPCQSHPFGTNNTDVNRFRPDIVTSEDRTEEWIAAAPDSKGPYFRVPRTIEE